MKIKNILVFGIVLVVVLSLYSVFAQENEIAFGEQGTIKYGEGTDIYPGETTSLVFSEDGDGFVEINGNKFENINHGNIDVYSNGDIKSAHFFTNEKGGEYNFNGNIIKVPPNSEIVFFVSDENENVFSRLPEGTEIKEIKDPLRFDGLDKIKFWKENQQYEFSGDLNFREDGNIYFRKGDSFVFKGVEGRTLQEMDIFLDGKVHDESRTYFSFGENDFRFKNSGDSIFYLNENFPYLEIEKGNNAFLRTVNSEIVIQNQENLELDPLLRANLLSDNSEIRFIDGEEEITLSENNFFLSSVFSRKKSFPLELINQNSNEKVLIDDLGRVSVVKEIEEYGYGQGPRVRYEPLTEESIERLIEKEIVFKGLNENQKIVALQNLKNYYSDLNYETRNSFNKIEILSSEEFEETYPFFKWFGRSPGAFALPTGTIVMKDIAISSLKHEAAHEKHFDLGLIPGSPLGGDFNQKWGEIAGPYDKVFQHEKGDLYSYKDSPKEPRKPKHGYVKPYGGLHLNEDVATFVEYANNPKFFKDLINPLSEKYDIRYRKKLDLLYEYKFITDKEYYDILREAGVQ